MNLYIIPKAQKQLDRLPDKFFELIISKIKSLAITPYPSQAKKLINRQGWRLRVGDYRIIYMVEDSSIYILSVGHRREIYKL